MLTMLTLDVISRKTMFKVLFVCSENTCRSPMAQYIFNKLAKDAGAKALMSTSAGIYAKDGAKMSENAKLALTELGINSKFKSHGVNFKNVNDANLIVAMTARHKVSLVTEFNCLDKTVTFAEIGGQDIPDPYGQGLTQYRKCASLIFGNCVNLIRLLIKEKKVCLKK